MHSDWRKHLPAMLVCATYAGFGARGDAWAADRTGTSRKSLVKRGVLTLGTPAGADLYPLLPRREGGRRHSLAQLLDDERGTR
jgi:hypothetical protein